MKSFLEKSKRALVLLLTGAMIATSVPSTIFAAPLDADDVIIEEVTDAVANDAVVEEEIVGDEPSEAVEALGAVEGVEGESDSVEADDAGERTAIFIDDSGLAGIDSEIYGVDFTAKSAVAEDKNGTDLVASDVTWTVNSID